MLLVDSEYRGSNLTDTNEIDTGIVRRAADASPLPDWYKFYCLAKMFRHQDSNRPIDFLRSGCLDWLDWSERDQNYLHGYVPDEYINKAEAILVGDVLRINYSLAMVYFAQLRYGVGLSLDPRIFSSRGLYFQHHDKSGFIAQDKCVIEQYGGSFCLEFVKCEGNYQHHSRKFIYCRRRTQPPFVGTWSLPGGRSEGEDDVPGLRELVEETKADGTLLCQATPLATLDQKFFNSKLGGQQRNRVYVWQSKLVFNEDLWNYRFKNGDHNGNWSLILVDRLVDMAYRGELSPTLMIALFARGYLEILDFPEYCLHPQSLLWNQAEPGRVTKRY